MFGLNKFQYIVVVNLCTVTIWHRHSRIVVRSCTFEILVVSVVNTICCRYSFSYAALYLLTEHCSYDRQLAVRVSIITAITLVKGSSQSYWEKNLYLGFHYMLDISANYYCTSLDIYNCLCSICILITTVNTWLCSGT